MKEMKRILSLVLCLVMLVGYLPVNARAEGETTTEPSVVLETVAETVTETTEETEPAKPDKPADPKTAEGPKGPGKDEKPAKPEKPGKHEKPGKPEHEKPGKPEHEKPGKPGEETVPVTETTVPETTEVTVPVTEETVPETTAATVPETTEATVPETTEETVPETTEETLPAMMMMAAPKADLPENFVDAAVIITDLHTRKNGITDEGDYGYKKTKVTNMMTALKNTGLPFSSVTSGGDMFSVNENEFDGCYTDTLTGYIQGVLGNVPVNYVWSDHDRTAVNNEAENVALDDTSRVVYGDGADGIVGTSDDGNYYVFALSMADMSTYERYVSFHSNAEVAQAIKDFETVAGQMHKDRPLLIVSHQPLLDRRDDNGHALEWATAINTVAENMDVAFFFGHNHNYDQSGDYYYAKGSTMPVCKDKNGNAQDVKLNFAHMCAGYFDPATTGYAGSSRQGTVMVVTIYKDEINYTTYCNTGAYTGNYALNETVTRDHAKAEIEEPTEPSQPVTPEVNTVPDKNGTGITVAAPGVTGVSASVLTAETGLTEAQTAVSSVISGNVVAYDIRVEGFVDNSGTKASVTIPIPSDMAADKFVVYHVAENGEIEEMPGEASGQTYTFETDHFSVYVGGEKVSDNTQVDGTYTGTGYLSGATVYKLDTDGVDNNAQYLIVNENSGDAFAFRNNNGNKDKTGVTITDGTVSSGFGNEAASVWTFTASNNKWYIANGNQRIRLNNNDILNKNGQALTVSHQGNGAYIIQGDRYLHYGTNNWERSRTSSNVYLFKQETTAGTSVTFTLEAPAALTTNDTTYDLTYKIELGQGTVSSQEITWTSDNNAVVTVANGVLTVKGEGTTDIKAELTRVNGTGLVEAIELTVPVTVSVKQITSIAVPSPITVFVGTSGSTKVADITVTYDDGSTTKVPLTLSMLHGSYNTDEVSIYEGLTVGYGGKSATVTLNVIEKVVNNYPEYPHEGAVKVSKTGTGIDFQSSGIAQVEVSASGVPLKKGADVIVMLDTSSSMTKNNVTGTNKTRAKVLEESLANLITYFKTPGEDGEPMDLRVAIADFNGYYGDGSGGTSDTPYDRTSGDYVKNSNSNGSGYQQPSKAKVYTGSEALNAGAFVQAKDLAVSYTLNYTSGTNYDYAFDAIYQLGTAIKTEDRDLYVIFMSDGASLQWNYFGTQNTYTKWNNWLAGTWDIDDLTTANLNSTKHSYFYDLNDHDGDHHINEHRMANAIKGDPNQRYEIIRKNTAGLPDGTLVSAGKDYLYTVPGLGATMFTINFDAKQDGQITVDSIDKSLASTASDQTGTTKYYYKVTTADELKHAFDAIGSEIAYAASNARFVDQMGDNYNLQMETATYKLEDKTQKTLAPKIEILSYDIYTKADAEAGKIPEGSNIGDRKGTFKILETVTFSADGTKAYSDQIGKDVNILADGTQEGYVKGVIYAKTFLYNTNVQDVAVAGVNIPTGVNANNLTTGSTNVLPSETFYWKLGTVQSSELAMRYYVYLEGSMEGTKPGGSYPTNEFATLYYDNYVGKPCYKDTVSPVLAWKEANVSYAFYLVNENGEIIVNQTTGQTGSFANKIAVTNPVVHKQINLNNADTLDIASLNVVPDGYKLYDATYDENGNATRGVKYTVTVNSNTSGSWKIDSVKGGNTTYVMQYDPNNNAAYSYKVEENSTSLDYTHTVVWFAVVWTVGAYPDTVVIDYGLPVDISVLSNDMFGNNGRLDSIGAYNSDLNLSSMNPSLAAGFDSTFDKHDGAKYGTAKADISTGKVRYTLNTMQMDSYEKFAYAVHYDNGENTGYYYDTVTVIPATTIYYEDDFLNYESYTWDYKTNGWIKKESTLWSTAGNVNSDATQGEDRPGKYALQDANNIYGYDGVNLNMSTHSLGSAAKATVDYDNKAYASFTFCGTGFDVISMTSNMTGLVTIDVEKYENGVWTMFDNYAVDTYYGYKQVSGDGNGDGTVQEGEMKWVVDPYASNSIYQVPIIKMVNKPYARYRVTIMATYSPMFDHVENSQSYDFYLDAIRIYDPANDGAADNIPDANGKVDTTIEDAYKADGEGWPSYIELRNTLIDAGELGNDDTNTVVTGLVFIDGDKEVGNAQLKDYVSYGPNNEVYLAPGQRVAFLLNNVNENVAGIHIGIKSANGAKATYTITNIAKADSADEKVKKGDYYNARTTSIDTATDMYYDLTEWKDDIIVISNTGDRDEHNTTGIISLTNIKATYKADPKGTVLTGEDDGNDGIMVASEMDETSGNEVGVYMTPRAAMLTLRSLNAPAEENVPETSEPEESVPETTEPEVTEPEETEPETTEPEETEPEETKPDQGTQKLQKEIEKALKKAAKEAEKAAKELQKAAEKAAKALSKLVGSWF